MKSIAPTLCLLLTGQILVAEVPLPVRIEFNRDVRPILSDNCFPCHGPDPKHRKAKLRLDLRDEAITARAIAPGKVPESKLIDRILTGDPDDLMPPPDSHRQLTARQKEVLKRWIDQGAEYQQHWAYEPPVKASIPSGQVAIDILVQRRLAEIGWRPSPGADRRTLIRRLYSDLLGLPPRPEEVAAFVMDPAPDAYARLTERVLGNPHYGERMAMGWLDVVRFADTIGYHSDNPRNIWPYRDWVIRSFNANKPFDRFTREQIAGDLLPDANQETRVGSAFNRLLLSTEEGGAQARDYEQRMLTDRVRAVGTAWLGQTTGCSQCHDHKFDPFSQRDFYSLGAFFADLQEPIVGRREDGMLVTTPAQEQELADLDAALTEARRVHEAILPQLNAAQQQWEADILAYGITLPELQPGATVSAPDKKNAQQVMTLLQRSEPSRNAADQQVVRDYFQTRVTRLFPAEREALAKARTNRKAFHDSLPRCLVSVHTTETRTVRILSRGNWMDQTGEIVKPALPHYLPNDLPPTKQVDRELTRLDLAQWLVSRRNPLTARTVMNRLWKQCFGTGLSRVLDDLGAQGEPPSNPALLDWLACEFMDSGWDFKHMVRLIVTSQTYQQVSTGSRELLATDPYNREFARQGRFRIEAELVRDHALFVSGLLTPRIGGPSAKPYQPERYWENLNFPTREYLSDTGDNQYRRGLYTWWQRTFLHPSLAAFDAPSREESCAERTRSNLPQQALALLNDPTYTESSRAFAARILRECPGSPEQKLLWAWQQALQRDPQPDERKTVMELFERQLEAYRQDPTAADALLKIGFSPIPEGLSRTELAAWTHVARVLLNLHESITRA